jgi:Superinfection immunity protein
MVNVHATGPFGLVILVFLVSGYFVPTIVCAARNRSMLGVFLLNLLLGWTFVGWLVALYAATREAPAGVAGATG